MATNSSLDDVLAILEQNKDVLSAITVSDVLTTIDASTQEELLSFLAGTGYGLDTVEEGKALLAGYPSSATLYDVYYDLLTSMSGAGDGNQGEVLIGTDADDTLVTGTGNDRIEGGAGDDTLLAGAGNDSIFGGAGDDILTGGTGKDYMEGGTGADTYYVDNKKDIVFESDNLPEGSSGLALGIDLGSTIDTVVANVTHTLANYVENLTLASGGTKKVAGTGNDLGNVITGNTGSNKLVGKEGADTIDGGAGADKIAGGDGADIFVFSNIAEGGADAISDFADEDVIKFDTSVFTSMVGASVDNLAFGTAAVDGNDYLIYSDKGVLAYDADGSGATYSAIKIVAIKGADVKSFTFADLDFS